MHASITATQTHVLASPQCIRCPTCTPLCTATAAPLKPLTPASTPSSVIKRTLQVNSLADVAGGPLAAFKDSFLAMEGVLTTVMHAVVPPPGGQIIAAAIAIGALLIKGAINVKQCCELATWCNTLLFQVTCNTLLLRVRGNTMLFQAKQPPPSQRQSHPPAAITRLPSSGATF